MAGINALKMPNLNHSEGRYGWLPVLGWVLGFPLAGALIYGAAWALAWVVTAIRG